MELYDGGVKFIVDRQTKPASASKTANIAGLNSTLQSGTKPIIANSKDP